MSFPITFTWENKTYSAYANQQKISKTQLWVTEFSNNNTFVLAKLRHRWYCEGLKSGLCKAIGRAIEKELDKQSILERDVVTRVPVSAANAF